MSNSSPVSIQVPLAQRCNHINARGHRCRMFAADAGEGLCPHHLGRLHAERAKNDEAVAELLGPLEDFVSPASVNFYLGNLLKLMARKKIDRRDALAQAYICQLLLNTFPHMRRELESDDGPEAMQLLLDTIANSQKALPDAPDSSASSLNSSTAAPDMTPIPNVVATLRRQVSCSGDPAFCDLEIPGATAGSTSP